MVVGFVGNFADFAISAHNTHTLLPSHTWNGSQTYETDQVEYYTISLLICDNATVVKERAYTDSIAPPAVAYP